MNTIKQLIETGTWDERVAITEHATPNHKMTADERVVFMSLTLQLALSIGEGIRKFVKQAAERNLRGASMFPEAIKMALLMHLNAIEKAYAPNASMQADILKRGLVEARRMGLDQAGDGESKTMITILERLTSESGAETAKETL